MELSITTTNTEDTASIKVVGEVDVSNAQSLRAAIEKALRDDARIVEVDMADVPYIDSTGIGVLVASAHQAQTSSSRLVVTNPQRNVARVFSILGVDAELGLGEK